MALRKLSLDGRLAPDLRPGDLAGTAFDRRRSKGDRGNHRNSSEPEPKQWKLSAFSLSPADNEQGGQQDRRCGEPDPKAALPRFPVQ